MSRRILFLVTLLGFSTVAFDSAARSQEKPVYEVYAISYGVIQDFPVSALVAGADQSRKMDIQMMVWLIKGPAGRNILVDSGFYREKFFKQWKVKDFVKPSEAVAKFGVKPEEVTDIIITHMHWDHADGFDLFPRARVWIQKDEYAYYTGEAWQSRGAHAGIDPDDVMALVKLNLEGRVKLIDGDDKEPMIGVRCYTGGRHTYASQFVGVNTKAGVVVVASDNLYLYENLELRAPIAATLDAGSNLKAQERMRQLASDPKLIVPGHDPLVFTRFPNPGGGVAKIE
ncbi:MAG TPA: N-acyl homoserine lactonase family protein [Blastocatellia bacterium]|jgi:glyoxylase-like metal-dependent hydrolase (beta-lactamase superfamily II)|nr:N-acyl homoserine lactonase family protein [Blastocatellia bacterium]